VAKTARQYQQEIEELQARLQEAEETLEAIRSGQVDAIVVTQGQQEQVFTLQGAESAYRVILENLSEGAATLTADGSIVYCNARFAEIVARPLDRVLGTTIEQYVLPEDRATFAGMLRQAVQNDCRGEVRFQGRDGAAIPLHLSLAAHAGSPMASVCMVATDLTERKRSDQILASEQFVRRLIDNTPMGVAVVGRDLRYILANPAYRTIAGDRGTPVAGRAIAEVFPPAVAQIVEPFVQRVLASGQPQEVQDHEAPIRGRTWWNVSGIPLRNGHGETEAVLILTQEVTERKLAEDRLREGEERFRRLFEDALTGNFVAACDGRILLCNPAFARIYGFSSPQEAIGFSVLSLKARAENWAVLLDQVRQHRILERVGSDHQRRDGTPIHVIENIVGIFDAQGELVQVKGYVFDDTERKCAEEALTQSEANLRDALNLLETVTESTDDLIAALDDDFRYILFNAAYRKEFSRAFGADLHIGDSMVDALAHRPEDQRKAVELWAQALKGESFTAVEQLGVAGTFYEMRYGPLRDADGNITGAAHIVRDITERKRMEKQVQEWNRTLEQRVTERTAEAEHRTAQLRAMTTELTLAEHRERQRIAKVLHDHLQQLLVGAKFHVSIVRSQVPDPEARQSLDQIDTLLGESIQSSRSLTAELFPPALLEGTFTQALRWLIQWMRDKHDLQVHFKTDEQANPQAEEIRLLLFEATRELLFNIVKHAGVREACLDVVRHEGSHVRIRVADSGRGFDVASVHPVERSEGGFGLPTIRQRLHLLGGRVEIESTPGQGTRATLVAPL
jgi:PAS domain S-box-containing protein